MSDSLSQNTKVTVGAAASVIVAFLGGALWINNEFKAMRAELGKVQVEVARTGATKQEMTEVRKELLGQSKAIARLEVALKIAKGERKK